MPALEREPEPVEDETDEDDYDSAFNSVPKAAPAPVAAPAPAAAPASFPGKVVSMNRGAAAQEIVRYHPSSFKDAKGAAKDLVASKAVIVNLDRLGKDSSCRIVDFLSGVVFAIDGDVQKITPGTYVFCPPNVFISGGPEEVQAAAEEIV
jgi:cell division inhibitor SepF